MSFISDISNFKNPFGVPSKNGWKLTPGVWIDKNSGVVTQFFSEIRANDPKGILTAIDQITDTGSRRLAVYEYPYVDGQRVKDLGRKGETYSFNIKFFGPNYQVKLKEFYKNVYQSNSSGQLVHPVLSAIRGAITTRLQSFEPIHRADEWNSVTFRAVFIEDNTDAIDFGDDSSENISTETALQRSLQDVVKLQANVSTFLASATALLQTPAAITAALNARKNSVLGQISGLLGQLAATFSQTSDLLSILSVSSGAVGGVAGVSDGAVVSRTPTGTSQLTKLPPVFQVGLDSATQTLVEAQMANFVASNQITTQQAVYQANQTRASITQAIAEAEAALGNDAYDVVVQYRAMAVSVQQTVESCISAAQARVKLYKLPRNMSLRQIAFANGLSPERQNDIENLNPYLPSVNLVPKGSTVTIPAA